MTVGTSRVATNSERSIVRAVSRPEPFESIGSSPTMPGRPMSSRSQLK